MSARQIAQRIQANVNAYMADEITYEAFHARQRELWSACDGKPRMNRLVHDALKSIGAIG